VTQGFELFVYGAGGHGKVVADVARSSVGFTLAGFIDDAPQRAGTDIWGVPVVPWAALLDRGPRGVLVALGIGDNGARERVAAKVEDAGFSIVSLVHATAVLAPSATIGVGTVLMAKAVVNPDAVVGPGCIVNTGAVVEHDCVLGGYAHLSPNAALGGAVRIGARTHLGLGAVTLPGVTVGDDVRVGAGAVVHRDVDDGLTVVGVPARPLQATEAPVIALKRKRKASK
jgi:sugar O-acyltransferase (sialic acid O-acetyltransferase NeuD family)